MRLTIIALLALLPLAASAEEPWGKVDLKIRQAAARQGLRQLPRAHVRRRRQQDVHA